jgi:quercetin dioxygenase-like cupin family protein
MTYTLHRAKRFFDLGAQTYHKTFLGRDLDMTQTNVQNEEPAARTPGAHRARKGEFVFNFDNVNQIPGGPGYSPVYGGCIEGDRMIVALMTAPAGKTSELHSHPNEQWVYLLEGVIETTVDGQQHAAHPGDVVYIPANTLHSASIRPGKDAKFFTVKDASWSLHGSKAQA